MFYSGKNHITLPKTKALNFSFSEIHLDNPNGAALIGFSGDSLWVPFLVKQNALYNIYRRKIGSPVNGVLNLSGSFLNGKYNYYVNGQLVANDQSCTNNNLETLVITTTSNTNLYFDGKVNVSQPNYSVTFATPFVAGGVVTGIIHNYSDTFDIHNGYTYQLDNMPQRFTGVLSGTVTGQQDFFFYLNDTYTGNVYTSTTFDLYLNTSIGENTNRFALTTTDDTSSMHLMQMVSDPDDLMISVPFTGSGVSNAFIFIPQSGSISTSIKYQKINKEAIEQPKTVMLLAFPDSPTGITGATSPECYWTGVQITNSGAYSGDCPSIQFVEYFHVTGIDKTISSILLSSGCTGSVPITFLQTSGYGSGASGLLNTSLLRISGTFATGVNDYYVGESFTIINAGSGYLFSPVAVLNTGVYSNCYDAPAVSGSAGPFTAFSGTIGRLGADAAYMSGIVLCDTGNFFGTGYLVTGIEITNPGSGYNMTYYLPSGRFVGRLEGDTGVNDASANLIMNSGSGLYSFTGNWALRYAYGNVLANVSINSGVLLSGWPTPMYNTSGYSGIIDLTTGQDYLVIKTTFYEGNFFYPAVIRVIASGITSDAYLDFKITGTQTFSADRDYLKKNDINSSGLVEPGEQLPFDMSDEELNYYLTNEEVYGGYTIELGDLDF